MNSEILQYLVQHPDEVDEIKARELEEINQRFPFYDVPLILLTRYYYQHKDYRYTGTLEKCALRVNDRSWLKSFVEQGSAISEIANKEEVAETLPVSPISESVIEEAAPENIETGIEELIRETGVEVASAEIEEPELAITADKIPAEEIVVIADDTLPAEPGVEPEPVPAIEVITAQPEETAEVEPAKETEVLPVEVPDAVVLTREQPEQEFSAEEEVYEEIQDFNTESDLITVLPAHTGENGIVEETENREEEAVETNLSETTQAPVSDDIMEFVAHFTLSKPMFEPIVEEENRKLKPATERKPISVSGLMKGSAYNIEDYYSDNAEGPSIETEANDFFSWLSHPSRQGVTSVNQENDERKKQAKDLINRFISSNPQVQRPKAEFFTPQSESKKSEEMPIDLVTETLAAIYEKQGNYARAIKIYEALILKMPEKSTYFADLIQKIKERTHQ